MVLYSYIVSTDEERPMSNAAIKAKQLGVQFIDPISIISCNTSGYTYYDERHDVRLKIPEGAILPTEGMIDIEFGVAMYGPFKLADEISVRRVSPVVWLCIQQDGFSGFQKDVELTIPHFLDFSTENADQQLRFLKTDHQLKDYETEYQLMPANGTAVLDCAAMHGTLMTRHFCSVCIATNVFPNKHTKFCLFGTKKKERQHWKITFFVCYSLPSCIRVSLVI